MDQLLQKCALGPDLVTSLQNADQHDLRVCAALRAIVFRYFACPPWGGRMDCGEDKFLHNLSACRRAGGRPCVDRKLKCCG
jgi:hypothetical protein